jgi:hypothetical protein
MLINLRVDRPFYIGYIVYLCIVCYGGCVPFTLYMFDVSGLQRPKHVVLIIHHT